MKEKRTMKTFDDLNWNRKKVVKAIMDPANESVNDVALATKLKPETILRYLGDDWFIKIIQDAKKAFE